MSNSTKKIFADNMRFLRKIAGIVSGRNITQNDIANSLKVARKTVVFWEGEQIPSKTSLEAICKYFSRILKLNKPLIPQQLLEDVLEDHFLVISETREVRKVTPVFKKSLYYLFTRVSELTPEDLEKVMKYMEKLELD